MGRFCAGGFHETGTHPCGEVADSCAQCNFKAIEVSLFLRSGAEFEEDMMAHKQPYTPQPPEWMPTTCPCPSCGEVLDVVWEWASVCGHSTDDEWGDYEIWFATCEDCQVNFNFLHGEPIEIK